MKNRYIVQGRGMSTPTCYVMMLDNEDEIITNDRSLAYEYDSLSRAMAVVAEFNRYKPFRRPDLTWSWEGTSSEGTFASSAGMSCQHCYARQDQPHSEDCPGLVDDPIAESLGWEEINPGWNALLAVGIALALAWLYVVIMLNRPVG